MRLEKIELFGFKSFADRTEILFDRGVTCVVGPNGCGKSNISDAIRWVLGERSAKLLRGSKMEDVIFNGTDHRKPLAMAEVSLTIDNADRGLPIEYQQVTITRRLYRSGESEYLINKTLCRLKDIQDLILDTGIGSNSYSMIEQGRIDYVLNADADERRFLIEEAAGISKFKVKKEEAIRKLERTEENLLRLKDIVSEVHKNIQYAERQARRAERYKEQLEKLKDLEIRKAFYDLGLLSQDRSLRIEDQQRCQDGASVLEARLLDLQKNEGIAATHLRSLLQKFSEEESKRYGLRSELEKMEQQLKFHQENKVEFANRCGRIQQETQSIEQNLAKSESEVNAKRAELETLKSEEVKEFQILKSAEEALKVLEDNLAQIRDSIDHVKLESFECATELSKVRNEYHRLSALVETSGERKQRQVTHSAKFQSEISDWEKKKSGYEREARAFETELAALEKERTQWQLRLAEGVNRQEKTRKEIDALKKECHERQTRFQFLVDLESSSAVHEETILSEVRGLESKLIRTLRDIFEVKEGYEWALESALGHFARSIVADDWSSAEALFHQIRKSKPGSMGLLLKGTSAKDSKRPAPHHAKIRQSLKEIVKVREGYESLAEFLIDPIYIVESLDAHNLKELAALAGEYKFVTEEGLQIGPHGLIFFRNAGATSAESIFQRKAEIGRLKEEIASREKELTRREEDARQEAENHRDLNTQWSGFEEMRFDTKIRKESFEQLCSTANERLADLKRELQLTAFEAEEIHSNEKEASVRIEDLTKALKVMEQREADLRSTQESFLGKSEAIEQKRGEAVKQAADNRAQFENYKNRSDFLKDSLRLLEEHDRRDRERLLSLQDEAMNLGEKDRLLDQEDEKIKQKQIEGLELAHQMDVALELRRREKETAEEGLSVFQRDTQTLRQQKQEQMDSLHQIEMKLMEIGYQEKIIRERLQQTYQVHLTELNAAQYEIGERNLDELQTTIAELRSKMDSVGTVNLLAIEEYEELKQRYDFLISQQKDLEEAREALLEAIRKINRTTKSLFEETFINVQKTFQEYYQVLFRGGEARLVLVDETNPLESGIDIVVRPPGKKLQHITLLSGGEKALTAIALLFALFKIKPSPFCVLDEVDAPLDEANIDRFLTVLRTFLETSQFIITTHNRKTIAMGDSLYGVTMQEAGVSKIVSVKINNEETAPSEKPALAASVQDKVTA